MNFICPQCGQKLVGTIEHAGSLIHCPSCNTDFVAEVAAPTSLPQVHSEVTHVVSPKRNPLLISLVVILLLILVAVGMGSVFFFRTNTAVTIQKPASPSPAVTVATPAETPKAPKISPEARQFLLSFVEKASAVISLPPANIQYPAFEEKTNAALGVWETLKLAGVPKSLNGEMGQFQTAMDAWMLARDIWRDQLAAEGQGAKNSDLSELMFILRAGPSYEKRFASLAESLKSQNIYTEYNFTYKSAPVDLEAEIKSQLFSFTIKTGERIREAEGAATANLIASRFNESMTACEAEFKKIFANANYPESTSGDSAVFFKTQSDRLENISKSFNRDSAAFLISPKKAISYCILIGNRSYEAGKEALTKSIFETE